MGYAEGPGIDKDTLSGQSSTGLDTLLEDIREAQEVAGFRHYITDAQVTYVNDFVRRYENTTDVTPPEWSNTYNVNQKPWPDPAGPPIPRIGIQRVIAGKTSVTVSWDVALDLNRVGYALYYGTSPFDFVSDPKLTQATRIVLTPEMGDGYENGVGPGVYPYQQTITGLLKGTNYYFLIRAFDTLGNEDTNQVVKTAATSNGPTTITIDGDFSDWAQVPVFVADGADAPDSAGPDWLDIRVANDANKLYIRYSSDNAFNLDGSPKYGYSRSLILIDADDDPNTGWVSGTIGSDILIAGDKIYRQKKNIWADSQLGTINLSTKTSITEVELEMALSHIYGIRADAPRIRMRFINDDVNDIAPNVGHLDYVIVKKRAVTPKKCV